MTISPHADHEDGHSGLSKRLSAVECRNVTMLGLSGENHPIFWKRAIGSEVWDEADRRYLDFTSAFGVASVGHSHPQVVDAIRAQAGELIHGMGDVHPSRAKVELLERLAVLYGAPDHPAKSMLSLSGSDAVEAALKTVVMATGRTGVIAFEGAYHGLGYGALNATWRNDFREPFRGQLGGFVSHVPYPSPVSRVESMAALELGLKKNIGAVIMEPIQGRGGIVVPEEGALREVAERARNAGALVIFDEIMTGLCRTGDTFAWMHEGVRPDILVIGKALGGGLPISAVVARADVMDAWPVSDGEAIHTGTFFGDPLACRAALAALDIMESENLGCKARCDGEYILSRLSRFNARGRGMMVGIPCASPRIAMRIADEALVRGLLVLVDGSERNVIALLPPLNISRPLLDEGIDILEKLFESAP